MSRNATCKICNKIIDKNEEKFKHNNKTYCKECHEKYLNEKQKENDSYKELISYICEVFNMDAPTGFILKQIKNMKDNSNYTYSGIQYTIWYYVSVLNKSIDSKYGIAFVNYNYENAKQYFSNQQQISNSIKNKSEIKVKIISNKNINNKSNDKHLLIDLSKL